MTFDFFEKVNDYAREQLRKTPLGVTILEYDETSDMLLLQMEDERVPAIGKEFMQRLMERRVYYVQNPEFLKESTLLSGYHIKRKLQLKRIIERNYVFNDYYEAENFHNEVMCNDLVLIIDYLEYCSVFGKHEIKLGNLLIDYLANESDKEKTINKVIKKIEKKMKKYSEACFLTDKEKEWVRHALSKEFEKCEKYVEEENM